MKINRDTNNKRGTPHAYYYGMKAQKKIHVTNKITITALNTLISLGYIVIIK